MRAQMRECGGTSFFFSSRRRHTRLQGDWSSDVCSSDLKELRRGGRPLIEDPVVRAKIGKIYADLEVQRYAGLRVLSALNRGESPGAASSITKLSYTEFEKRYYEAALEILGPWGQLVTAPEEFEEIDTSSGEPGTWATAFLWSRAGTIYSGSSEIQKNIIGERVLGLPKEVRADRLKA